MRETPPPDGAGNTAPDRNPCSAALSAISRCPLVVILRSLSLIGSLLDDA